MDTTETIIFICFIIAHIIVQILTLIISMKKKIHPALTVLFFTLGIFGLAFALSYKRDIPKKTKIYKPKFCENCGQILLTGNKCRKCGYINE